MPNSSNPNGVIAPFWTDLNPELSGNIYYQLDEEHILVQYNEVSNFSGTGAYTFEVSINKDGTIKFQYLEMDGDHYGTTGIESSTGSNGITFAFNGGYLKDEFAIEIIHPTEFISPSITAGVLQPGNSQTIDLTVYPEDRIGGTYQETITIHSNDTANSVIDIPVNVVITGEAKIALDTNAFSFDTTFVNDIRHQYVRAHNYGTDVFTFDSFESDNPHFFATAGFYEIADSTIQGHLTLSGTDLNIYLFIPFSDETIDYIELDFDGNTKEVPFNIGDSTYNLSTSISLEGGNNVMSLVNQEASLVMYNRQLEIIDSKAIVILPSSISVNSYGYFQVFFNPTNEGTSEGTINIIGNEVEGDSKFSVSGVGESAQKELALSTSSIVETLHVGDSSIHTFVIENTGIDSIEYKLKTSIKRLPNTKGDEENYEQSATTNEFTGFVSEWTGANSYSSENNGLPGDLSAYAYGGFYDYSTGRYSHAYFEPDNILDIQSIKEFQLNGFSNAGEFIKINGVPHLMELTNNGELVLLNLNTSESEIIQTDIYNVYGMTIDPQSGIIFTTNGSGLFIFDFESLTNTYVGSFNNSTLMIDLAMDNSGRLYGFDIQTDNLYSIDPLTGSESEIGYIGFNSSFGQGMAYDEKSDQIYISAINTQNYLLEIRSVDTETGLTDLVSSHTSSTQMGWMAFPNNTKSIVTMTSTYSSLAPGETDTVEVAINATNLFNGTYLIDLLVDSDDDVNPNQIVELKLNVYGNEASYSVNESEVEFGNVKIGETSSELFTIANESNAILEVSLSAETNTFQFSKDSSKIGVGKELQMEIQFEPDATGIHEDYIFIHSNDPQVPLDSILVRGTGVRGSTRLALSNESFEFDLWKTECDTAELNIANIGEDSVYWSISILDSASWFSLSTYADSLISNESSSIEVTYCDPGDSTATYSSNLLFTSNDPLYDSIVIPITLNVTNRIPYFVELPTDQIIDLRDTLTYHLHDLVYDEDADDLTFEIVIENDTITNYTLTDSVLTLVGNRSGDSRVDINVNDGEDSISVSFNVRVNAIPLYSSILHPIEMPINSQMVINLEDYFTDLEGDELTYGVTTNEDMVTLLMTQTNELIIQSSESIGTDNLRIIVSDYRSEIEISTEISIYKPLSADDFDSEGISIYPIPTNDYVNIELDNSEHFIQEVNLTDLTGKVVNVSFRNIEGNLIVDMKSLKGGVYLLNINLEGDKKITTRLIKE